MSSSTSSSDGRPLVRAASFALAFAAGWIGSWAAVWVADRAAIWDRLGVTPEMEGKWDPPERDRMPGAYLAPTIPMARYLKRRSGPLVVEGNVLADAARHQGYDSSVYEALPPIRVSYDRLGFRDELPAEPGGAAMIGSSYVDASFAAAADTIPGWLRRDHGIEASNFGVPFTGGAAALVVLESFVMPTRPAQIVWLFAERSDFSALLRERSLRLAEPAPRLAGLGGSLTSVHAALWISAKLGVVDTAGHWEARFLGEPGRQAAQGAQPSNSFRIGGREVPIHLSAVPTREIVLESRPLVASALERMRDIAAAGDAQLSVVFVPVRTRTLAGRGVPPTRLSVPPRFARVIEQECARLGIPFGDVTGALRAALDEGVLVVNPVWDTHLNSEGMRIVARSVAAMIAAGPPSEAGGPGSAD